MTRRRSAFYGEGAATQESQAGSGASSRTARVRLSRRSALKLLVVGTGMSVLAACAPAAPQEKPTVPPPPSSGQAGQAAPAAAATAAPAAPTTGQAAAPATQAPVATSAQAKPAEQAKPAGQPKTGGTLRLAVPVDVAALDPHILNPNVYESTWLAWDRLAAYDLSLKPQPMLAESWEQSSDLKRIKLNLRKGVTFHSGRDFTSDDVKYNFERVKDPKSGAAVGFRTQVNWWTSIETPDKYTVILTSEQPRPATFDFLQMVNMADREVLEGPDAKSKIGGTGPFVLQKWAQGTSMTFTKNKNYWQSGRPYLDGIEITVTKDAQAMVAGLETQSFDVIKTPPLRDFVRLKADPTYVAMVHPASGQHFILAANCKFPPFDNKKVRQALNWAADRKRFNETVLLGTGDARSLPWNSNAAAFDQAKNFSYSLDLDKARALLSEAGVSSGFEIDLLTTPDLTEFKDFLQIYQGDLATIGVKANIKVMELAAWLEEVPNTRRYHGMYFINSAFAQMEPFTLLTNSRGYDPVQNNSEFKSDQYLQVVTQVAQEPDATKRKALYSQINDLLLDEAFALAAGPVTVRIATRAAVKGVETAMTDGFVFTNAWLDS